MRACGLPLAPRFAIRTPWNTAYRSAWTSKGGAFARWPTRSLVMALAPQFGARLLAPIGFLVLLPPAKDLSRRAKHARQGTSPLTRDVLCRRHEQATGEAHGSLGPSAEHPRACPGVLVASDTDWEHAGITGTTVTAMIVRVLNVIPRGGSG